MRTHYAFRSFLALALLAHLALPGWADDGARSTESAPAAEHIETATFSMFCYWTGEATLGQVDGVVASRIGHWSGNEIVQVDYDTRRTTVAALTQALKARDSLYFVVAPEKASRTSLGDIPKRQVRRLAGEPHFIDPKHSLRTRFPQIAALELTEAQAIALNSWSYFGGSMPDVLTDEQRKALGEAP